MAGAKSKATAKRRRATEKSPPAGSISTPASGKRRRKGRRGNQVQNSRPTEEANAYAENEITKLLNEAREAMTRSAETGDDLDSDLEILKDAVKEAEEADMKEVSDTDSISDDYSKDAEMKSGKKSSKRNGQEKNSKKKAGKLPSAECIKNDAEEGAQESAAECAEESSEDDSLNVNGSEDSDDASPAESKPGKKAEKTNRTDDHESDNEDSEDGEGAENHRADLDDLKMTDPEFYKYLKENDAELLEFDAGSGSEEDHAEQEGNGGGSESEDDEEEESRAAAEAGLDVELGSVDDDDDNEACNTDEIVKSSKSKKLKQKRDSKVIDLGYLRELQAQLSIRRNSLKACRDLLRIFRAGRELAVSTQIVNKSKKNALKAKKKRSSKPESAGGDVDVVDEDEDSDDEIVDDKGFVAGEIRFASSKAYQKAMNMAIIGIQGTLDVLLAKPRVKSESDKSGISTLAAWTPREHKRWENLEPTFKTFVYHMVALTEHMKDARTLRFLLKRLECLVPYTKEQPSLARKLTRIALSFWTAQSRDMSHATKLRAYLLLHAVANEDSNTEIVLRKTCQAFTKSVATVCNPRTLPSIIFAVKCIVELFGINMGASYTVAFTHLRQMAVTLRTVLTSKDMKTDIEKIYNWTTINSIRLWSSVLSRYGSEDELEPLIYPFVQVSLGILRLQSGPRNYPLRLQVCSFVTDLAVETGVFIPVPPHLLAILRCAELKKVPKRGATRALEWRSILRVADDVVGTKPYLGGIVQGVVMQLAKYFAGISKHVSFPEISHAVATELRKFSKELRVPDWRRDIGDLCDQLKKTAQLVTDMRAKADFGPKGALGSAGMLEVVPGFTAEMKTPIQRMYEIERKRKEREEALRDEALAKAVQNRDSEKKNAEDAAGDEVEGDDAEEENEGSAEESGTEDEIEEPVVKKSKKNKSKSKQPMKSSLMTLVASDEEPDEVAEFHLSDSEDE